MKNRLFEICENRYDFTNYHSSLKAKYNNIKVDILLNS